MIELVVSLAFMVGSIVFAFKAHGLYLESKRTLEEVRAQPPTQRIMLVPDNAATEPDAIQTVSETVNVKFVAKLPEHLIEPIIGRMRIGDQGWTVPWAMSVDTNRNMWLNPSFSLTSPGGTVSMLIARTEDGFLVQQTQGSWGRDLHHQWDTSRMTPQEAMMRELIPVYAFKTERHPSAFRH